MMKKLDSKRFEALASHSRSPAAAYITRELEHHTNELETVIGVILIDIIDHDYAAVVMGRDESGRFRAIDNESSMPSQESARQWLEKAISFYTGTGKRIFPQGDEKSGIDLFLPVVAEAKQHPYFTALNCELSFIPAKRIIQEMMPHFIDIDGNFVEQFQSTGFDSRLWELYLNSYFVEEQLFIERNHHAPDFVLKKYGETVALEAVIVGRKTPYDIYSQDHKEYSIDDILEEREGAMPIKFGSPLYSKLKKKYWELPHVKGNPLVIGIADFHDDLSMLRSSTALINYLYGVKHEFHHNEDGNLVIDPIPIEMHQEGKKHIPSGFFFQPEAENVSAVLFSASGTISKFNRIGKQCGFGDPRVIMIRKGTCHDHDPNAVVPIIFEYRVDQTSSETWGEGLSMFHNPAALHKVSEELFPSIAHHYYENEQIISNLPEFHPYGSITLNYQPK